MLLVHPIQRLRVRGFLAHPGLLGEPFVLSSADRAIGAGEEHRQSLETCGLDVETRRKSHVPFGDIGT